MRIANLEAVQVAAVNLKPHPENPRRGNEQAIQRSIQENGWYGSLVVQKSTGYILAGWHRFVAGQSLGMSEFPVVFVDCDASAARRILLSDNRTSDVAGYNEPELLALLNQLTESFGEPELLGTGYDADDVALIAKRLAEPEPQKQREAHAGAIARVGEYTFHISRSDFLDWQENLRQDVGFAPQKVLAEIFKRLGLEAA